MANDRGAVLAGCGTTAPYAIVLQLRGVVPRRRVVLRAQWVRSCRNVLCRQQIPVLTPPRWTNFPADEQMQAAIVPYSALCGRSYYTVFGSAIGTSSYSRTAAEHGTGICTLNYYFKYFGSTTVCSGNGYGTKFRTTCTVYLSVVMYCVKCPGTMDISICWPKGAECTLKYFNVPNLVFVPGHFDTRTCRCM